MRYGQVTASSIKRLWMLASVLFLTAGTAVADFRKIATPMEVSSTALTEDGQYLVLAHKASSKVSIWNVRAQSLERTVACQLPGPMLCRGGQIYIVNLGQGTISVFNRDSWELVNEIQTPQADRLVISAPQGDYFDGRILMTTFIDRYLSKLYVIDVEADRYDELSDLGSSSGMTVSYSGKVCLDQDQLGGSPSGAFQAKGTFDAIVKKRSVQDFGRNGESNPLLYQVRDSEFWFGSNRLYRGLPPKQVGDERGRILLPDHSVDLMYTVDPQQVIAHSLTGNMAEVGRAKVSFPKNFERMRMKGSSNRRRGEEDRQHAAVTLGDELFVFLFEGESGNVYHERFKAFGNSASNVAADHAANGVAGRVATTGEMTDGQLASTFPSQIGVGQAIVVNLLPRGGTGEFSVIGGPQEIDITETGKLTWSPIAGDIGPQRIKIRSVVNGKTDFIRLSTVVIAGTANAQNGAMPVVASAVAQEFTRLPVSMAISSAVVTEDAKHLILAHFASDKLSVWNIADQKVEATIECASPGPMISRRDMTYVGNHGQGTISMIDHKKWTVLKTVDVGERMIHSMSAPQGRYFTGAILVTSHIDRNNGKYTIVDTRRNRYKVWHAIRDDAVAVVSYNGKFVLTQAGGGSASGSIDVHSNFAAIAAGRPTQEMKKMSWDRVPLIRQVRDNEFWFGSKWLFRGMPPKRTGEEQREIIVGDRTQDVFYRIEPERILAFALDGSSTELGRTKTAFPPTFERMQPNNRRHNFDIDAFDRDHIAVTIDGRLHLFLMSPGAGNVYYQTLTAFAPQGAVARRSNRRTSGAATVAKELTVEQPRTWKDRSGKFSITATLMGIDSGNVTLKRDDGTKVSLPASRLSDQDRAYLLRYIANSKK